MRIYLRVLAPSGLTTQSRNGNTTIRNASTNTLIDTVRIHPTSRLTIVRVALPENKYCIIV
jgi:hypothetical protein